MMRKLDERGSAALEFCLVAVVFFTFVFAIFDLGRYTITMQSLRTLSDAGARKMMIDDCYVMAAVSKSSPTCSGDYLSTAEKQDAAPFLFLGGLSPTLNVSATTTSPYVVTASQPNFPVMMPIWGTALNQPSASTKVPF